MTGWPFPGDTPVDRARHAARDYRQALSEADPEWAAMLDARYEAWGETWIRPVRATNELEDWVTVDVAADHVGLTPAAIYKWIYRKRINHHKGSDGRTRVRLGDAIDVNRAYREQRARRQQPGAA